MKDLEFKSWVNENETKGLGLRGLFRGTCGDKSCSRGSGRGWDPDRDNVAKSPSLIPINIVLDNNTKGYYNPDAKKLLLADTQELYKSPNKNVLSVQFVENAKNLVMINKMQILSFINNYNKNKSDSQYKDVKYLKYFRAQNSVMVEFELVVE